MMDSKCHNPFAEFLTLMRRRLSCKRLQTHWFVIAYEHPSNSQLPANEMGYEVTEMTAKDNDQIDELTEVDEWNIPKSETLETLEKGWRYYIAKHKGRIAASQTIVLNDKFEDPYFKREFKMAPDEAFLWRGFTVKAFRGKGIFSFFMSQYLADIALKYGKTKILTFVHTANKTMLKTALGFGMYRVGRVGFLEVFGLRFHYLWGRRAFKETKKRFFIQNVG